MQKIVQVRDLTVWQSTDDEWLVFAIDGLSGIGELLYDEVIASPEDVGYFTARVVLFELLAANVIPQIIVNTLSAGSSYGDRIIAGIRAATVAAGLPLDFSITGSSEDNLNVQITSVGITAIGRVTKQTFRSGTAQVGDAVWLVGIPKSAPIDHVYREDPAIVSFSQLRQLLVMKEVHELLPIGSKGATFEAEQMAKTAGLHFTPATTLQTAIATHSGGPATAVIVVGTEVSEPTWKNLRKELVWTMLGKLEENI